MRATVLADNTAAPGLPGEWGLSIYIEENGKTILLDTGSSALFADNADRLGLSLSKVDAGVLSHWHYDHANGMETFFARNDRAKFYLRKLDGEDCYSRTLIFYKHIGIPRGILGRCGERIELIEGQRELCGGIWLLPHSSPGLEQIGRREKMYVRKGRRMTPDSFSHEQSLVYDTDRGLVIFNSCCHGGADRIIREAQQALPGRRVHALIGGFHLHNKSEEEVRAMAGRLRETGVERIFTGHCTGERACQTLRQELGDRVKQIRTGFVLEL